MPMVDVHAETNTFSADVIPELGRELTHAILRAEGVTKPRPFHLNNTTFFAHITKNDKVRTSNLDRRTTRQPGYAISLSRRWLIENGFGWLKQTGPLLQVKLRGLEKVDWLFGFSCAAHNLIRLPRLMAQPPEMLREKCA